MIKLEKSNVILLFILISLVIISATTVVVMGYNFFEVKEFNLSSSLQGKDIYFKPSAISLKGDNLIVLNDKLEKNLLYFYFSDLNGNITGKKPVNMGRDTKGFEAITTCNEPGVFYALMSHSSGNEKKRGLFKINVSGENYTVTSVPEKMSDRRDIIYDSFNRITNAGTINIEGMAYYKREKNEILFMGVKKPDLKNETDVWRLNFKDIQEGKIQTPTLWFKFYTDAGKGKKESISSIEYYPKHKLLFILTSYESETDRGGALWVAKANNPEDYGINLPPHPVYQWKNVKPEGLTLIKDKNGKNLIFIIFANGKKDTAIKGTFTVLPLDELIRYNQI